MTADEKKATLEKLRIRTGLTRMEFAKKYHIGTSAINEWARPGGSGPPENILYLLQKAVEADYPVASNP